MTPSALWQRAGSPPSEKSNQHVEPGVATPVTMVTMMFIMMLLAMAKRRLRDFRGWKLTHTATATPLSPLLCPLSCFFLSTGVLRASLFRRAPPARSPTAGLIAHRCRQLGNRLIGAFRDTSVRRRPKISRCVRNALIQQPLWQSVAALCPDAFACFFRSQFILPQSPWNKQS